MGYRLGNMSDRAVLVDDAGDRYDLATLTGDDRMVDPLVALASPTALHAAAELTAEATPGGSAEPHLLGPPVPRPRQVFGVGINYRSHADETNADVPPSPLIFTKFPGCLAGPTADIELRGETVDYEVELVVVIGPGGRDIAAADAWDHVAGLTVGQDISDRTLQFASAPPHFDLGKSRDGYGPIGPVIVSTDLVADPADLALSCSVNGEVRQDDRTTGLIVDVPTLIEYLSGILTLHPGDLIFTGTPSGVGLADGRFLKPGDLLESEIEGIGKLTNRCV
jgi:2-keto-4-pentenoate hydratase/2-oxohepta-3-ene-1,7-dioic acid hydratase in catechol pathway